VKEGTGSPREAGSGAQPKSTHARKNWHAAEIRPTTYMHSKEQPSLLSMEAPPQNYRGFMNLAVIVIIAMSARLVIENLMKYGLLVRFRSNLLGQWDQNWPCLVAALGVHVVPPLFAYTIERMATLEAPTRSGSKGRRYRVPTKIITALHILNITLAFLIPQLMILYSQCTLETGFILAFACLIVTMKLISYAHVSHDLRCLNGYVIRLNDGVSLVPYNPSLLKPSHDVFENVDEKGEIHLEETASAGSSKAKRKSESGSGNSSSASRRGSSFKRSADRGVPEEPNGDLGDENGSLSLSPDSSDQPSDQPNVVVLSFSDFATGAPPIETKIRAQLAHDNSLLQTPQAGSLVGLRNAGPDLAPFPTPATARLSIERLELSQATLEAFESQLREGTPPQHSSRLGDQHFASDRYYQGTGSDNTTKVPCYPLRIEAYKPTFHQLAYFLVAPTLIYQLSYPRTDRIRKLFVLRRLIEIIFIGIIQVFVIEQYVVPTLANSLEHFDNFHIVAIVERVLKLCIPNLIIWLLMFYSLFHSYLNLVAELTRFGDRVFYRDWWNSGDLGQYWRLWNRPVHDWLVRHAYCVCVRAKWSEAAAKTAVFFISAVLHEVLISVPLRMVAFHAFFGMFLQVPVIMLTQWLHHKSKNPVFGNTIFWLALCIFGQPLLILQYGYEYVRRNNVVLPVKVRS